MFNIVKIVGCKKSNTFRQILFVFSLGMLVLHLLQIGPAINSKDYIAVPGYISDMQISDSTVTKKGVRNTYQYTIHWYYEGEEYTKTQYSGSPVENVSEVWIDKDNSDVMIYSPDELSGQASMLAYISAALFVIWLIMYLKTENVEYNEDIADNVLVAGAFGTFLSLIFVLLTAISYKYYHEEGRSINDQYTGTAMLLISVISLVVCVILTILAAVETKKLSARS